MKLFEETYSSYRPITAKEMIKFIQELEIRAEMMLRKKKLKLSDYIILIQPGIDWGYYEGDQEPMFKVTAEKKKK